MKPSVDEVTRRTAVRSLGAGFAALRGPSIVGAAKPDFEEIIERAHHIREKTASQERFLQYLRKQGLAVANQRTHYKVPAQGTDGFTIQELAENDLTTDITLVYQYFHCSLEDIYTEYHWTWNVNSGSGESPKDYVSLGWPSDHYDYQSQYSGSNVTHFDRDNDLTGSVWKYDDTSLSAGDSASSYAGCYLKETTTDQDRHVGGKYRHTWNSIEFDRITYGSDGTVEVTFENTEERWKGGFEKIYESEAEYDGTNC